MNEKDKKEWLVELNNLSIAFFGVLAGGLIDLLREGLAIQFAIGILISVGIAYILIK